MRSSVLLLSLSLLMIALPSVMAEEVPHVATETVKKFHEALAAQEKEGVLAVLSTDVLIFESGGAEFSREEYAGHHLGADMEFSAAIDRKITDQQAGQDGQVAWVLTRTATTGTFREKEIDARGVETMLLRHTAEGWKIFHIHWSSRAK